MKKAEYTQQPAKLQAVGNGSHLYRWGIEQVTKQAMEGETATISWQCFEVVVWGNPTADKVTEAVVTALWPSNIEAKLINDYNAAKEGLLTQEYEQAYIDFINQRKAVKNEIKLFFDNESI